MRSRAVIEQAKGVLMARGSVSPDDGFQILVRDQVAKTADCVTLPKTSSEMLRPAHSSTGPHPPAEIPVSNSSPAVIDGRRHCSRCPFRSW